MSRPHDTSTAAGARTGGFKGYRGDLLLQHRALRVMPFDRAGALLGLLLAVAVTATYVLLGNQVTQAWVAVCQAWMSAAQLPAAVSTDPAATWPGLDSLWPHVRIALAPPALSLYTLAGQAFVLAGAFLWQASWPDRAMPLRYIVRILVALQAMILLYFLIWPAHFPYRVLDHTKDISTFNALFIALVPWIWWLTYFPFVRSWPKRLASLALVMGYFLVATPVAVATHATLVHLLGSTLQPLLFLFAGPLLDLLVMLALYAWTVTWEAPGDWERLALQSRPGRPGA